ncbi:MAG: hypothetical protein KA155_08470 [Alphaproteobacteria bacterium]|jgi:hypothetical protein|nr:hypothetical protein [Alphaproteobacteria bacterium]
MTTPEESHKKIDDAIKTMTTLMQGLGIVVMAFGSFCLLVITPLQNFTGYSAQTITMVSWAFLLIGLCIIAVPYVEKMRMRKLK